MADDLKTEELDASIERIVSKGQFLSSGDEEVDALGRLAIGLRGLPDPDFRAGLALELTPRRTWRVWPRFAVKGSRHEAEPTWLRRNRPFAIAGAGYGLLAGACCTSGAIAKVLGLASAAAISSYIGSALPYYVAVSLVGLAAWLVARLVREQRLTPKGLGATIARHGLAMGSAYGAVFGASMALAMAMGLY